MKLVYYSLACSNESNCASQWVQSIRSLRRYNRHVPVYLFLYNTVSEGLLHEASRWGVAVHHLGDYRAYLHALTVNWAILAQFPTFHKILSLAHVPGRAASQILYVDCDTFFFSDVELLFDLYRSCDWYAREEPLSQRSHYGYDPAQVDEAGLSALCRHHDLRPVEPFNTGVCLFNHGLWHDLDRHRITYLDWAWRLLMGRFLGPTEPPPGEASLAAAVRAAATAFERSRAIPYPSQNFWIVEEVALWLTLGHLPGRSQGFLTPTHSLQGGEPLEAPGLGRDAVLAHYFSSLETAFFAAVPAIRD